MSSHALKHHTDWENVLKKLIARSKLEESDTNSFHRNVEQNDCMLDTVLEPCNGLTETWFHPDSNVIKTKKIAY